MSNTRKIKGHPQVIGDGKITGKMVRKARRKGWSGGQLIAHAIQQANPGAVDIKVSVGPDPERHNPSLRSGYIGTPHGSYPLAEDARADFDADFSRLGPCSEDMGVIYICDG